MAGSPASKDSLSPLVIGVTGHRDLVESERDELSHLVFSFFARLREQFPSTPLCLMTALAEGADRLVAAAALDADVSVQAILPMPAAVYETDFETPASKEEFEMLCRQSEVVELPSAEGRRDALERHGPERDFCYANAGMFISAHCHILLALWDGIRSERMGGTSQIIYFQHYDRLPGVAESVPRTSLFLTDDESDLVYHITCSRRSHGADEATIQSLQTRWFTTDPDAPSMDEMPARYVRVFERADEYNRDILRHARKYDSQESAEADPPSTPNRPAIERIRRFFDTADRLANHFQKRVSITLACIYTLAFLTGLTFIVYSEVSRTQPLIYAFLSFLLVGIVLAAIARRREWHRKYLDYRVLAEGLRVQYYWAIAGVRGGGHTKFAYDNFLRQRDMELGWIRNVMRVAGTLSDALPPVSDPVGLEFAIRNWIGSPDRSGQLNYYRHRSVVRDRINRLSDWVMASCLWSGVLFAVVLALFPNEPGGVNSDWLFILMGVLPLIAGIAEVYTQRKADRELVKQYRFMAHVFANAARRLDAAVTDSEKREVLLGLGDAALSEHAEWILVHRERQPEPAGL